MGQDKRDWEVVLLFATLLATMSPVQVAAFRVIDHAMCHNVDVEHLTCVGKGSEFDPTAAVLWAHGYVEQADIGSRIALRFYDPRGSLFAYGPPENWGAMILTKPGDLFAWMGIGATTQNYTAVHGQIVGGGMTAASSPWGFTYLDRSVRALLGEWRAELTLSTFDTARAIWNDHVVVSESFVVREGGATQPAQSMATRVGTHETAEVARSSQLWFAASVAIVILAVGGVALFALRRLRAPYA